MRRQVNTALESGAWGYYCVILGIICEQSGDDPEVCSICRPISLKSQAALQIMLCVGEMWGKKWDGIYVVCVHIANV